MEVDPRKGERDHGAARLAEPEPDVAASDGMTRLLALLVLLVAAAQPGSALCADPIAGGCNHPATGVCDEWTGSSWAALKMQRLCESQQGTFAPGGCPVEGRLGACLRAAGKKDESRLVYYAGFPGYGVKLTPAAVATKGEDQCTRLMKGVWTRTQP